MNRPSNIQAVLQIQPEGPVRDAWNRLAVREGLMFEVMELSLPPALCESGRLAVSGEWYRITGRAKSLHGAFIDVNPASGDPLFRELSRKRCRESCQNAVMIGAENVIFHSSCLPFIRGPYLESWAGNCAEFFEELAEKYNLRLFIENSQDVSPLPIRKLMSCIKDARVGVCLDLGHVNYSGVPLETWLDELGSHIGYLHLSDNNGIYDEHLPIGDGTVDWEKVDRFFKSTGKTMPMTFEVGGLHGVIQSLDYLKRHRLFGMS